MDGLTVVCASTAIAIGTGQLVKEGLQDFLDRPPGVGATPSDAPAQPSPKPPTAASHLHRHGLDLR
jgi:hypothetical protein